MLLIRVRQKAEKISHCLVCKAAALAKPSWTYTHDGSRAEQERCSVGDLHSAASKDCGICARVADLVAVGRVWMFVTFGIRTKPQGGG